MNTWNKEHSRKSRT